MGMKYTVRQVAEMSGISTRTLRYYDQIGLLKPSEYTGSGYRIYKDRDIDRLQQILLYRSMELKLEEIRSILDDPEFNTLQALEEHYQKLQAEQEKTKILLATVGKTIQHTKGEIEMSAEEKFEGFKKAKIEENERKYGEEIREKYGEKTIDASNRKYMNLSKADFDKMQSIEDELFSKLEQLSETKDIESPFAREVYELHKEWLMYSWTNYSAEAHRGLAQMYVDDERFAKYYNARAGKEVVSLLRDSIERYAED